MFEIRIHGRGGQGVVTAAELLSVAGFLDGEYAQAFPSFGSERTGAPVVAFCRLSATPIRSHEPVLTPDALIVQDPTLLHQDTLLSGLRPRGYLLINSTHGLADLGVPALLDDLRAVTVPATALAREHLGRPVPNVPLLGAFAALTERVSLTAILAAIARRFPPHIADGNQRAAHAAYDAIMEVRRAQAM